MPWTAADAKKHKADVTDEEAEVWKKVANERLADCEKKDGTDCEGSAIKQANTAVNNMRKEAAFEAWFDTLDEELRGLVETHIHGLKSALDKERTARKDAERKAKEAEVWSEDVKDLLKRALNDEAPPSGPNTYRYWIRDVSVKDALFVYTDEETGDSYKRTYAVQGNGSVLMGPRVEVSVNTSYTPIGEAAGDELLGDVIPLMERAVADDGTIPIKIIQPGWGTSGYYGPDILERDGPKVFKAGTQMFWDHPTLTEETERPERSLRDLSGELVEDAHWDPHGYDGPGLYSRGKVFDPFKDSVDQLASHIGLSMNGWGRAEEGEAEGKKGPIIKEIGGARSVDFVTVPGAGGQILELFEAARGQQPRKRESEGDDMANEQELKEAQDALAEERKAREKAETETARLREVVLLGKAKDFVGEKLAEQDIPEMTKERLIESLSKNPPVKDGKLDEDKLIEVIDKGVKDEMAYLAGLSESGQVRGLGESGSPEGDEADQKKLVESFKERYLGQGYAPETAERMAEISVRGR